MEYYSNETYLMLKDIYTYRCLTVRQSYRRYHSKTMSLNEYLKTIILPLANSKKIDIVQYNDNMALFLTNAGIELIRSKFALSSNIYDDETGKVIKGYQTAGSLKIMPKLINHQVHLNEFVFSFKDKLKTSNIYNIETDGYEYFDEKFMSQYTCIRPDGMIRLKDVDLFLEMDMSTESMKQLIEKWRHYRLFLKSVEYRNSKNKIIVLFIVANTKDYEKRKNFIRKSLNDSLIDFFDNNFDIYIGSRDEIFDYLFKKLIPKLNNSYFLEKYIYGDLLKDKHKLYSTSSKNLGDGQQFNGVDYGDYIRKINKNNKIPIENGKVQEFLFQECLYSPISLVYRISYLSRNTVKFRASKNRDILYIVLVENEERIYNDLKVSSVLGVENTYFTTINRLETMPFHEAVFSIGYGGIVRHFKDSGFNAQEYERSLK